MNNSMDEHRLCSIQDCPREATHTESAGLRNWTVTVYYCAEHDREMEKGTPLGGLAVDGERVSFRPREEALPPATGNGAQAVGPQ